MREHAEKLRDILARLDRIKLKRLELSVGLSSYEKRVVRT
jgi:hypothetical protein